MKKNNMPALLFGAVVLGLAAPASAALYRCGNVFQDRPCDASVVREAPQPGASVPAAPRRAASVPMPEAPAASLAAPASPAAPATSAAVVTPALEPASAPASAAAAASTPVRRKGPPSLACPNLRVQLSAIQARLQAGGRPQTVEMYQRQRREVEKSLEEGICL
ncbi:MAG TPA: hypothetical protein VFM98_07065 [Ramlibacter sp.]|uniref:hypothetical protein n=1 Tax=Ramlibacter sp. TaxID=1917967 RepID=UPI002D7EC831|nr:hypothetical protein [Ramlibacter sp.]HET8745347.1 hypothetical protein [Ramlibacter sp.]